MPREIEFLFDFGGPNSWFVHRAIPAIEAKGKVKFRYAPVLLGGIFRATGNKPPLMTYGHVAQKVAYDRLEMERFMTTHGISGFQFNPHFPVNTLKIMRGAVAAQERGCFAPYVDAVYAAMWERGLDMADDAQIGAVLAEAGLDAAALVATSQDAAVKQRLLDNTQQAHDRGAFGSPSFFVGDQLYFGKDRLRDVEEAAAAAGA